MPTHTDVIIIGAGQAGLAMSHCLAAHGIDHVLLERGRVGERWMSERWPGLRLLTPNWMTRLPGLHSGAAPDGFMTVAAFAATLARYASRDCGPVITGCEVLSVCRQGERLRVCTTLGDWTSRHVVVATGACDKPIIPGWANAVPDGIRQVTASSYRGPENLPEGGVLVVGASATGVQLAEEIHRSGRPVTIAVGRHVRTPRRYRGRDLFHWLDRSGFLREARSPHADNDRLMAQPSLQLVGGDDGRDIGLDTLAADGVRIAGRAIGISNGKVRFAPTLGQERQAAEARRHKVLTVIDRHISDRGLVAPSDPGAWTIPPSLPAGPNAADIGRGGIRTIIWATGFRRAYPWLKLPVLDRFGEIVNRGGVTPVPGLHVLGLPFMRHRSSAFIDGVGQDAEAISAAIAAALHRSMRSAA